MLAQESNARVIRMWEVLNLRAVPDGEIIGELASRQPVFVSGRTRDNRWYQVQTQDGQVGWAGAGFIELTSVAQAALPIVEANAAPPAPQEEAAPQAQAQIASNDANARVNAGLLNLRSAPSTDSAVLEMLPNNTRIHLVARSADGVWLQVQAPSGVTGWVSNAFVRTDAARDALPIASTDAPTNQATSEAAAAPANTGLISIGPNTWNIFRDGQQRGNRATVFAKVGDSITVEDVMYNPIGFGRYNLGAFANLQATIDYFTRTPTRTGNSFNNQSLAAQRGWTTETLLNPEFADPQLCERGASPLACEYRITRPAVALIMIGSNDVAWMSAEDYAFRLGMLTEFTVQQSIIPVLSSIPNREGFEGRVLEFNQIIRNVAAQFGVPFVDYHAAMAGLPNAGISGDGLHPSIPPQGFVNGANFAPELLQFGYVTRNLLMLQTLDVLRRTVLQ